MFSIDILGTGTPMLDQHRCGSGVAISGDDGWILVDCGRGVTQRIAEAGLGLDRLLAVCLTHHHTDHVSDLATLAMARWSLWIDDPLVVLTPEGPCASFARHCLDGFEDQAFFAQGLPGGSVRPAIEVRSFSPAKEPADVAELASFRLRSVLVDHHPIEAAVGYGVDDGHNTVVISGDTAACAGIETMARGADVLIHEALRADAVPDDLLQWNASAESVGALAQRAGVEHVVLTHLIPAPNDTEAEQAFVDDTRKGGFTGTCTVAHDLLRIEIG